jgi:triosephosphate isomerase
VKKNKKFIVANWKMNPGTVAEAKKIALGTMRTAVTLKKVETIICPPAVFFESIIKPKANVAFGAQNIFSEPHGSYTGEISVVMVATSGADYTIIGHSERRKLGETDEMVNKKVLLAFKYRLMPIICIGEETRDEEGTYLTVIKNQLEQALRGVNRTQLESVIVAYEPVWAIGAKEAMNARDVHETTLFIKKTLVDLYKMKNNRIHVPILYGGAVDPINCKDILTHGDADGLLVGRQSLDPKSFSEILRIANDA